MTVPSVIPPIDEFLAASLEDLSAVAPRSMVYAPGGTRRSAAFLGIEPWSKAYLRIMQDGFVACLEVIFRYGVQHVFTPMIMLGHTHEVKDIKQELIDAVGKFATDPRLLHIASDQGWRVKLAPSAYATELQPYIDCLNRNSPGEVTRTWWMGITPSYESWWSTIIALAKSDRVRTRADAIRSLYGEDVPPITLCFSFGKPMISPDLFPPLLMDNVQCYWSQQVGYTLTDQQFRKVLYDYAFMRRTWQKDKTERAREAHQHQSIWEQENILGLGKRLGPFWYPEFVSHAALPVEDDA